MERVWQNEPSKSERIKRLLLNPMRANEPATAKIALIDRLEGTPYEIRGARAETPQHKVAREVIGLAVDLSETLLRFGAGAQEVEQALIAVTTAFGLKDVDIDITNQAVNVNYAPTGEIPIQVLRVTRSWTNNFMGLIQVHELVKDVIEHNVSVTEARDRVRFINKSPKPFAKWFVNMMHGIFTAIVVINLGGSLLGALVAFVISILVSQLMRVMNRFRLPEIYTIAMSSAAVTFGAGLFAQFHVELAPSLVVASGILALLPAMTLVSAIKDSITGFPVTASAQMLTVSLLFIGIVAGISIGLVLIEIAGIAKIEITGTYEAPPFWLHILLVGCASMAYSITEQTARRTLIPVALTAMAGYSTYYLMTLIGVGPRLSPAVGAVVVGIFARALSSKIKTPSLVLYIPAMINLLPGMLIFRSTYNITIGVSSSTGGMADLVSAIMIALGLSAGVIFGDYLGQPFEQKKPVPSSRR